MGACRASRRSRRRRILRKHKAAPRLGPAGSRGRQTASAACTGRAAGDVIGGIARAVRTLLTAGVRVAQAGARAVTARAIVIGSLEELEDLECSSVHSGCLGRRERCRFYRSHGRGEECGPDPDPPSSPHSCGLERQRR